MRRRSLPLLLALIAGAGIAATALGGGWAQVTATDVPVDPPAGTEATIGLTVLQHGETAVSWPTLAVVATDAATGTVVRTDARPEGPLGSYIATISFPSAGDWSLAFESNDLIMEGSAVVRVAAAVAAAAADPAPVGVADLAAMVIVAALVVVLVSLIGLVHLRGRGGGRPESPVSIRG